MSGRSAAAKIALALAAASLLACGVRLAVPTVRDRDARFGFLKGAGDAPAKKNICTSWLSTVVTRDEHALTHVSYPEANPRDSCFVRVMHRGDDEAKALDATPRGCEFPDPTRRAVLEKLAVDLELIARGYPKERNARTPFFECGLPDEDVRLSAAHDARVVRGLLEREPANAPYAAVIVPGHGLSAQNQSKLMAFRPAPETRCVTVPREQNEAHGGMMLRTRRAAALVRGGIAPIAIVSGAAVHSRLVEAFAMLHLMSCQRDEAGEPFIPIAGDRVFVEPCADHTHTNLRNSGRWLDAMGARAAYLVTDDFIQSKYFQDVTGFEFLLGSIDQRSLRDFGYLIGSWRQASVGMRSGFWFTPYRFWAEDPNGLGSLTCNDY